MINFSTLGSRAVARLTVPGGQEFHFPQIVNKFSYFSSNFAYFLLDFGPPGGQLAHLGRPWLRHCWVLIEMDKIIT